MSTAVGPIRVRVVPSTLLGVTTHHLHARINGSWMPLHREGFPTADAARAVVAKWNRLHGHEAYRIDTLAPVA